jgi:cobalt/nickel transport system permease protein
VGIEAPSVKEPSFHTRGRRGQRTLEGYTFALNRVFEHTLDAEAIASQSGFLQRIDPRFKLLTLLALIVSGVLAQSLLSLAVLFALAVLLALASGLGLVRLATQVWFGVLLFTGLIALPALVMVPGDPLIQIPLLDWTVTRQGLRSAGFLVGRAGISAMFALLLILTTPWPHVLKALRALGVPVVPVAILGMTHRYIFVFLQSALQMFEARRSRTVGPMSGALRRRAIIASAGALLGRAFQLSSEVHQAMVSRGYRGEVHLLNDFCSRPVDWLILTAAFAGLAVILWTGA